MKCSSIYSYSRIMSIKLAITSWSTRPSDLQGDGDLMQQRSSFQIPEPSKIVTFKDPNFLYRTSSRGRIVWGIFPALQYKPLPMRFHVTRARRHTLFDRQYMKHGEIVYDHISKHWEERWKDDEKRSIFGKFPGASLKMRLALSRVTDISSQPKLKLSRKRTKDNLKINAK